MLKYKKEYPPLPITDDAIPKMRMEENSGIFLLFLVLVGVNVLFMVAEVTWASRDRVWTWMILMRYKLKATFRNRMDVWKHIKGTLRISSD